MVIEPIVPMTLSGASLKARAATNDANSTDGDWVSVAVNNRLTSLCGWHRKRCSIKDSISAALVTGVERSSNSEGMECGGAAPLARRRSQVRDLPGDDCLKYLTPQSGGQFAPLQNRPEFLAAGKTEDIERFPLGREGGRAYLLGGEVGFAVVGDNQSYERLGGMDDGFGRHEPDAAYQRIESDELVDIFEIVSHGFGINAGSLVDEIGVKRLPLSDLPVQ